MFILKLSLFLVGVACVRAECESVPIEVIVYEEIDSKSETLPLNQLNKDVFHILVSNQSVKKLCSGDVSIQHEATILQLISSNITEIEEGAFSISPHLGLLKISNNPLSIIKRGIFNRIAVKELDLSSNLIITVDVDAFDDNPHLEIVNLNNNAIKEISSNMFTNSPNIYKLSLVFNEITEIPENAFANMAKTRPLKLKLSANLITTIDGKAFSGHKEIELLRVNGNRLTELPEEMFQNTTFRSIQINTNTLKCFPSAMFNNGLTSIEFLENPSFDCDCLAKVREFVESNGISIIYPAIICEDKSRQVNVVYNYNKTNELPLLPMTVVASALTQTANATDY